MELRHIPGTGPCLVTNRNSVYIFSLSPPVFSEHTSPCQQCPEDGCRQPKVCQGQRRSARTGRTASSETDGSGSASGSSAESTGGWKIQKSITRGGKGGKRQRVIDAGSLFHTDIKTIALHLQVIFYFCEKATAAVPFHPTATPSTGH